MCMRITRDKVCALASTSLRPISSRYFADLLSTAGIAATLIKWGTEQADAAGLETYLDGSEMAQPYYVNRHAFEGKKDVGIPNKDAYGSYSYKSMVRSPQ